MCGEVGLCVFVSVTGWMLIALWVELTELTYQRLAPCRDPQGRWWLLGTGFCVSFSVPILDMVPCMSKVHSHHLPTEHTGSDPLYLHCSVATHPFENGDQSKLRCAVSVKETLDFETERRKDCKIISLMVLYWFHVEVILCGVY